MQQYSAKQGLRRGTFYLALFLFDQVSSSQKIWTKPKTQGRIEGIAVSCLSIACKMEEIKPPSLQSMVLCVETNTHSQVVATE